MIKSILQTFSTREDKDKSVFALYRQISWLALHIDFQAFINLNPLTAEKIARYLAHLRLLPYTCYTFRNFFSILQPRYIHDNREE